MLSALKPQEEVVESESGDKGESIYVLTAVAVVNKEEGEPEN